MGQVSSSLKRNAWNAEDEDFDGLGLGKWDYANVVTLTKRVVTRCRPLTPASDPEGDYDYASGGEEEPEK